MTDTPSTAAPLYSVAGGSFTSHHVVIEVDGVRRLFVGRSIVIHQPEEVTFMSTRSALLAAQNCGRRDEVMALVNEAQALSDSLGALRKMKSPDMAGEDWERLDTAIQSELARLFLLSHDLVAACQAQARRIKESAGSEDRSAASGD